MNRPVTDRERATMLEARVAELEEELAAWRGSATADSNLEAEAVRLETATAAMRALGCYDARGVARLMLFMVGRPGRLCPHGLLFDALATSSEASMDIVKVRVSRARKALTRFGSPDALQTIWGQGYILRAEAAKSVAALLRGESVGIAS